MSLYTDASLIMYPSGYKEDKIYSLKPTDGSGDLTFTRASTATRVNAEGLIEESPVNLTRYSEEFNNALWTKYNCTIVANSTIAPNGTTTADTLLSSNSTSGQTAEIGVNYIAGQIYTNTIYAKYINTSFYQLLVPSFVSTNYINFNIETGIITGGTYVDGSITNIGNGWFRLSFTFSSNYTGSTSSSAGTLIDSGTAARGADFTGDGVKGVFIWGAQLNIGATAKPYFPTTDRLNVPRIDYTSGCGSLLLEKQSTNLVTYSEDFSNAAWDKIFSGTGTTIPVVTANYATSPDGTQNADRLQCTLGFDGYSLIQKTIGASGTHTGSIWVKSNTSSNQNIYFRTSSNTTAFVVTPQWQRITLTESAGDYITIGLRDQTGDTNYSCDISIYGAQLEASSYATSYIPTTSTAVTRLADSASKTGISSLIGQTQGTLFVDIDVINLNPSNVSRIILSDGTTNNYIFLGINEAGSGNLSRLFINNFSTSFSLSLFSFTAITIGLHKLALAYKSGEFALYLDGNSVASSSATGTIPATSQIVIGGTSPSTISNLETLVLNKSILFPTRLTNAQLATLTTL